MAPRTPPTVTVHLVETITATTTQPAAIRHSVVTRTGASTRPMALAPSLATVTEAQTQPTVISHSTITLAEAATWRWAVLPGLMRRQAIITSTLAKGCRALPARVTPATSRASSTKRPQT